MATNKLAERLATFSLLMPAAQNISSGQPLLLGESAGLPMVATEAQNTTNPPYDNNTGYLTCDCEGVYALTVQAETLGSVSAGAAFLTGDKVYASGGTYDKTSGITYGFVLCNDPNGVFFGRIMQPLAAGLIQTCPVLLRNAC
jgi:hypothetical protein